MTGSHGANLLDQSVFFASVTKNFFKLSTGIFVVRDTHLKLKIEILISSSFCLLLSRASFSLPDF